jgi:hypothetical protein
MSISVTKFGEILFASNNVSHTIEYRTLTSHGGSSIHLIEAGSEISIVALTNKASDTKHMKMTKLELFVSRV